MVRIAPVRLSFNPKTLWFDAGDLDLAVGDAVIVRTARGEELGRVSQGIFDMEYEQTKKLKSPLKPVERLADEEDEARGARMEELSMLALPIFRQMARETVPDMNPIAVEYLFEGDKAVFYFDSEQRVDFRELVRRLAAEFHVRVDMKQIGVRDGARMVGGLGHCGQELCCRRLGGEFNPVSIRMAKEQDLSLNPQKISGVCGRLMCCLRYEFEAYKDFHGRAPKKNARIETPEGEGKVVDLDVPREVVSIKVGDEKPVRVPLSDMDAPAEGARPTSVGDEAWERANEPAALATAEALGLFTAQLSGEDKLAEPGKVRHVHGEGGSKRSRSRRRGGSGRSSGSTGGEGREGREQQPSQRKARRRRSTTVSSDGTTQVNQAPSKPEEGKEGAEGQKRPSSRRRGSRGRGGSKQGQAQPRNQAAEKQAEGSQVGRNSSALRAGRSPDAPLDAASQQKTSSGSRRRRRRRSGGSGGGAATPQEPASE